MLQIYTAILETEAKAANSPDPVAGDRRGQLSTHIESCMPGPRLGNGCGSSGGGTIAADSSDLCGDSDGRGLLLFRRYVEQLALTPLPWHAAQVAELLTAPARHVVAPVDVALDEVLARVTPLPARRLPELEHRVVRPSSGAAACAWVRPLLAGPARAGHAFSPGAMQDGGGLRRRTEEDGAAAVVAVHPVRSGELGRLAPEVVDEYGGEVSLDLSQRDRDIAALWREEGLVDGRLKEHGLETRHVEDVATADTDGHVVDVANIVDFATADDARRYI